LKQLVDSYHPSIAHLAFWFEELVSALVYLHASGIIHRDVKPANCMIGTDGHLQLGDFGLATKLDFDGEKKRTICGTPNYIAPEVLEGRNGHSYEVDIWSLGVIIYTLIIGKPPFETTDVKATYRRIK
jgi:polo-like kinase 1